MGPWGLVPRRGPGRGPGLWGPPAKTCSEPCGERGSVSRVVSAQGADPAGPPAGQLGSCLLPRVPRGVNDTICSGLGAVSLITSLFLSFHTTSKAALERSLAPRWGVTSLAGWRWGRNYPSAWLRALAQWGLAGLYRQCAGGAVGSLHCVAFTGPGPAPATQPPPGPYRFARDCPAAGPDGVAPGKPKPPWSPLPDNCCLPQCPLLATFPGMSRFCWGRGDLPESRRGDPRVTRHCHGS